jgi:hypothetical protein
MRKLARRILKVFSLYPKSEYASLEQKLKIWKSGFVPPGHYYSPLNDLTYLEANSGTSFKNPYPVKDIDLRMEEQKELLEKLKGYYGQGHLQEQRTPGYRYHLDNIFYSYSDGIFLYCLFNHIKPAKVIEVGSGFSSALMMDINDRCFGSAMKLSFIEPFPEERLYGLMNEKDRKDIQVSEKMVQDIEPAYFTSLEANDVFFVDSSHVSKFKSDLNHILFNVLPVLKSGVYIHFHDIFFPFEYPKEWILSGRAWNEAYLLRAFLMNNKEYEIVLFSSMMEDCHLEWLEKNMPLTLKLHEKWPDEANFSYYLPNKGQSIWLRKK